MRRVWSGRRLFADMPAGNPFAAPAAFSTALGAALICGGLVAGTAAIAFIMLLEKAGLS